MKNRFILSLCFAICALGGHIVDSMFLVVLSLIGILSTYLLEGDL